MIYPCIDLEGGEVVQLVRGQKKGIEIAENYIEMAEKFAEAGLTINVIDIDAAKGKGNNVKAIEEIVQKVDARVGGGVRDADKAKELIDIGAKKVIFGTAAFDENGLDYGFLGSTEEAIGKDKMVSALDVKDEKVAVKGWQETIDMDPLLVVSGLEEYCSEIQCTCVDKEGMMQGTYPKLFGSVKDKTDLKVTAAGGITTLDDVEGLEKIGVNSVIGMSFYTGKISLDEVVEYNQLDFVKNKGLIPTIIQNIDRDVLYLQSTDREALRKMRETGTVWRYSKSQDRLLQVGSESGKIEYVEEIFKNCYEDNLLIKVRQEKNFACHEGYATCFYRKMQEDGGFEICQKRVVDPKEVYG